MTEKASKTGPASQKQVPVVGIGASAGGLEAFTKFFATLPPNTGMAFVAIQHLSPDHTAFLPTAIAGVTSMRVVELELNQTKEVRPNQVYVIAPGTNIAINDDTLYSSARLPHEHSAHHPIDLFFASLAEYRDCHAIGLVLSGMATDGTRGLQAIKEAGGLAMVQDPHEAKFSGMPLSAVNSLAVDFVLPVTQLADKLVDLSRVRESEAPEEAKVAADEEDFLKPVFWALKTFTHTDFSGYKTATVQRRIARRMETLNITNRQEYTRILSGSSQEAKLLQQELLIHVTAFFRDFSVFSKLRETVLPGVLKDVSKGRPVRVWVVGCATGEEVYSYAICLLDCMAEIGEERDIQVFGTDPGTDAIRTARAGVYSALATRDLSATTLQRHFLKIGSGYQINQNVRDKCVFVEHDALRDPPFCNVDIISCRNVLIYFSDAFKQKILTAFHFGLNKRGYLILGSAENVSATEPLFLPVDEGCKIFHRSAASRTVAFDMPHSSMPAIDDSEMTGSKSCNQHTMAQNYLLEHYLPPSVLVDSEMTVVHTHGQTAHLLQPKPGNARQNLLAMASPELLGPMRQAFTAAQKNKAPVCHPNIIVGKNQNVAPYNLKVIPLIHPERVSSNDWLYLIIFEPSQHLDAVTIPVVNESELVAQVARLKHQLSAVQDYMQQLAKARVTTSDATLTLNSKLNAANEELQSMNEEMQTSKEELHSTNEELRVVNEELKGRNYALNDLNTDLANLFNAVELPVLILDANHHIRRYTPQISELVGLREADIGRSLHDLQIRIRFSKLQQIITEVIQDGSTQQFEVQDNNDRWYRLVIRPCHAPTQKVVGAMLSFVDIDQLKQEVMTTRWARDCAKGIVEAVSIPLIMLNNDGVILSVNAAFYSLIDSGEAKIDGQNLFELNPSRLDLEFLRGPLNIVLSGQQSTHTFETRHRLGGVGYKQLMFSLQALTLAGEQQAVLLSIEDISERRAAEMERAALLTEAVKAREEAERVNRTKDQFLATLSHELRTPLSSIALQAELIGLQTAGNPVLKKACEAIERGVHLQVQLIEDLLDISRIAAGKLHLNMRPTSLKAVLDAAIETTQAAAAAKQVIVQSRFESGSDLVCADETRLQQVFTNLLTNAIKFSFLGGKVQLLFKRLHDIAQIDVIDTGKGIAAEFLPTIFSRFTQEESNNTRRYGGLGLGLAIAQFLTEQHGGSIAAASDGIGCGATLTVTLPLISFSEEGLPPLASAPEAPVYGARNLNKASPLQDMQILLVDDDDMVRSALYDMLTFLGAQICAVSNAEEAIQALDRGQFDILLCDIAMPQVSGYELMRNVRQRSSSHHGCIPAIALTAFAGERDQLQARAAGFARHIAKPISRKNLLQAIVEVTSAIS